MKIWTEINGGFDGFYRTLAIFMENERGIVKHIAISYPEEISDMNRYLETHIIPSLETLMRESYPFHGRDQESLDRVNHRINVTQEELTRLNELKKTWLEEKVNANQD